MLTQAKLDKVKLHKGFLYERVTTNNQVTLKTEYEQLVATGRLYAFRMDWKEGMPHKPHHFWDSDIAKWIEACAYSLHTRRDNDLEAKIDEIIDIMEESQQEDGYLNIYYQTVEKGRRFTFLKRMHELYCAGHLIEAAVSYYQATGKEKLLNIMIRYSDLLCITFGPEKGQKKGYPGHQEIELALIKLYNLTGKKKYLHLSEFFILERGVEPHYFDKEKAILVAEGYELGYPNLDEHNIIQAHNPLIEQNTIEGHAVRALYFLAGAADVAYTTGNDDLMKACKRLYRNAIDKRMYITGGVGSSPKLENFSFDYDLPNETAYAETCASIALVFFAHRMFLYQKDGSYGDTIEKALYNGILSGMSIDGTEFFYANPLQVCTEAIDKDTLNLKSHMGYTRKKWFGCACCPPNIARLLSSLTQYIYATEGNNIYVNLYCESSFTHNCTTLQQTTNYPWDENINISLSMEQPEEIAIYLRIPGWCRRCTVQINNQNIEYEIINGFIKLQRTYKNEDRISLRLDMPVEIVQANPKVRQLSNKYALTRGPIVFCLEQTDNACDLFSLYLSQKAKIQDHFDPAFLGGCTYLEVPMQLAEEERQLYSEPHQMSFKEVTCTAIPYALWTNREPGDMVVWINKMS